MQIYVYEIITMVQFIDFILNYCYVFSKKLIEPDKNSFKFLLSDFSDLSLISIPKIKD